MVDEYEFFRNVQTYYHKVAFQIRFTYRLLHKKTRVAAASGHFSCRVLPSSQTVEYLMYLQSDLIARPYSESYTILFSSQYEAIPPQKISFERYPILRLRYPVPIDYDWQAFMAGGIKQALQTRRLQTLFKQYRFKGINGQEVDGELKVIEAGLEAPYAGSRLL